MTRRLYVMRHGATLYEGRRSADGSDLTAEGRRQAEAAAAVFADVRLDFIAASPMRRALGTARIIAGRKGMEVEVLPDLREITAGPLDGMEAGAVFEAVLRFFSGAETTWDTPYLGGETFRELQARVLGVLDSLRARPGWSTGLLVAHGGVNSALLAAMLGVAAGGMPRLEQDLGCINAIDLLGPEGAGPPRAIVRLVNFTAHDSLKAALREPALKRLEEVLRMRRRGA